MNDNELQKFLSERNAAFESDDLEWVAKKISGASSPRVVEMAFHKARLECVDVSEAKRRESQKWLADHGFNDMFDNPVSVSDPLPT